MEATHRGHVHIHTLIDAPLTPNEVRRSWQGGRAKVERFDPSRCWRYYITKQMDGPAIDYDISL